MIEHRGRKHVVTDDPVLMTQSGPVFAVNIDQARSMVTKLERYVADPAKKAKRRHYNSELAFYRRLVEIYDGGE